MCLWCREGQFPVINELIPKWPHKRFYELLEVPPKMVWIEKIFCIAEVILHPPEKTRSDLVNLEPLKLSSQVGWSFRNENL